MQEGKTQVGLLNYVQVLLPGAGVKPYIRKSHRRN